MSANPAEFWESMYQSGETPWNKGAPVPGLVDFLAANRVEPKGRVVIPGCGFAHDVEAWAKAGFAATGYELAPSAVQLARARLGDCAAEILQGDFLADQPAELFDWLFEHTLFCAINPAQREAYVAASTRWLKPGGYFLAVHYLIPDVEGPPFGTTRNEVIEAFSPHFDLIEEWVPRSYENRLGLERMFWWRKR